MRTEQQMLDLILSTARDDRRIRAVIMNGSRANPNAPGDIFQDYDIVYIVTDVAPFRYNYDWIAAFGPRIIMQMPEDIDDPPPSNDGSFVYLMQFADGNRIDLTIFPINKLSDLGRDSQSILLLDKDSLIEPFPPASDRDYLPQPPAAKQFADCCNEFWWVSPYVAKGLWRREIVYAKHVLDEFVRAELMKMLKWHIGTRTGFQVNPGKFGKYYEQHLEPDLWDLLLKTYADADYDHTWGALLAAGDLFRRAATGVAQHFGFEYPREDDERVTAHLHHVRALPHDAREMY
jgi:aminoglycoside 6-adenylyltransferase